MRRPRSRTADQQHIDKPERDSGKLDVEKRIADIFRRLRSEEARSGEGRQDESDRAQRGCRLRQRRERNVPPQAEQPEI